MKPLTALLAILVLSASLDRTAAGQGSPPPVDKTQAQVHFRAAVIALENKDLVGAEEELRTSLRLDPSNPLALLNLATVQVNASPQQALTNLDKAEAIGFPSWIR